MQRLRKMGKKNQHNAFLGQDPSSANTPLTIVTRCKQALEYESFHARLCDVAIRKLIACHEKKW